MLPLTRTYSNKQLLAGASQLQLSDVHQQVRGSQRSLRSTNQKLRSPSDTQRPLLDRLDTDALHARDTGTQTNELAFRSRKSDSCLSPAMMKLLDTTSGGGSQHDVEAKRCLSVGVGVPLMGRVGSGARVAPLHAGPLEMMRGTDVARDSRTKDCSFEYDETHLQRVSPKKSTARAISTFDSYFVADSQTRSGGQQAPGNPSKRPSSLSPPGLQQEMVSSQSRRGLSPVDELGGISAHRRLTSSDMSGCAVAELEDKHSSERDVEKLVSGTKGHYRKYNRRSQSEAGDNQHFAKLSSAQCDGEPPISADSANIYAKQSDAGVADECDEEQVESNRKRYLPKLVRLFISSTFTYVLLCVFVLVWALAIQTVEQTGEKVSSDLRREAESALLDFLRNISDNPMDLNDDLPWYKNFSKHLIDYQNVVIDEFKQGDTTPWSLQRALVYVQTVVTTIGYGHIIPRTPLGRALTMVCALGGMPLFCLTVNELGSLLTHLSKLCIVLIYSGFTDSALRKGRTLRETNVELQLWKAFILLPLYLLILATASFYIGIDNATPQTFFSTFYWMFITCSTIGFGDITPNDELAYLLLSLPILAGCGIFAMFVNKIMLKYIEVGLVLKRCVIRFFRALRLMIARLCLATSHLESPQTAPSSTEKHEQMQALNKLCPPTISFTLDTPSDVCSSGASDVPQLTSLTLSLPTSRKLSLGDALVGQRVQDGCTDYSNTSLLRVPNS